MRTVGIICEYNPFHNGHLRQLQLARAAAGEDCALVCLMSGNYVQRGEPAVFDKATRARAAVECGADLALELPLTVALSSAEGFAAGGVAILTALGCDDLCYGMESDDHTIILSTAKANLDPAFDGLVRQELETGCSYAVARRRVLERLGAGETQSLPLDQSPSPQGTDAGQSLPSQGKASPQGADAERLQGSVPSRPNDILAVEYCKAILRQKSPLRPLPIHRPDTYHSDTLDPAAPSATALRAALAGRGGHLSDDPKLQAKARQIGLPDLMQSRPPETPNPAASACRDEHCSSGIRYECNLPEANPDPAAPRADKQCLSLQPQPAPPSWQDAVPGCLRDLYAAAPVHTMAAGERAVLAILRTLPEAAFRDLPYGGEGLWSKFMKNARTCASVPELLEATKSKRYALTRIRRMLLCAVLGLTAADLERTPPHVRILAFNDRGRALLRQLRNRRDSRAGDAAQRDAYPIPKLINAGQTPSDAAYYALEARAADLYSLFSADAPRPGGEEARQRVSALG